MYSIIAKWDDNFAPSGVNNMATESEAQVIVQTLIDKGRTNAFYFKDESSEGQECWRIPQHWRVNAENKTAALNQDSLDAEILSTNMAALRDERSKRLTATDIVVLPDRWNAMDDDTKTAWTNHRQALRDLPANTDAIAKYKETSDLTDITWPEKPE
tara:strand:+ start:324 stop:794 length:471 start_codon:yes stop_codon:yes gene_type:complete